MFARETNLLLLGSLFLFNVTMHNSIYCMEIKTLSQNFAQSLKNVSNSTVLCSLGLLSQLPNVNGQNSTKIPEICYEFATGICYKFLKDCVIEEVYNCPMDVSFFLTSPAAVVVLCSGLLMGCAFNRCVNRCIPN